MPNIHLSPEAQEILSRSSFTETSVTLPPVQLPRSLYVEIDSALRNAGGKWKGGKTRAHIFDRNPRELLLEALGSGVSIDQKKKYQSFYTPSVLADELVIQACVEGRRVLEPSAGDGAIVDACIKFGARQVDCVEIREECREKLTGPKRAVTITDFLLMPPRPIFERVVMNPPFAKNQDIAHIEHALKFLVQGGRLVSVISGNVQRPKLQKMLFAYEHSIRPLKRGAFKESGTNVLAQVLYLFA